MTKDVVQVSLGGLLALQSAAKEFARSEIIRIAEAAIVDLRSQPIVGYFEGVAARNEWDEYCWALQEGPLGSWNFAVGAFVCCEVEKLPHHALVFLSAHVFDEDDDFDEMESLGGVWVKGIVDMVMDEIGHRASERNLYLIGPDRGTAIGSEIQGSGMVWSALADRGEARKLIAGHVDTMIDPDADLSVLAAELVDAFVAAINEDIEGTVVAEFLERFGNDVRSLLLEQDVLPSLGDMRGALIKRLDGAPSVVSEPLEVPVNKWEVNRLALRWLKEAKEPANPQMPYVLQLAVWGLETDQIDLPRPIAPSQPEPEAVRQLVYGLGAVHGRVEAYQAMRRLFSNPNLTHKEEMDNLTNSLSRAENPPQAAQAVIEVIYYLMVATSP